MEGIFLLELKGDYCRDFAVCQSNPVQMFDEEHLLYHEIVLRAPRGDIKNDFLREKNNL